MTNPFVDKAKEEMGAIERLLKGLPIIRGYVDKELRRDADFDCAISITDELNAEKLRLYVLQQKLLGGSGLRFIEDVDGRSRSSNPGGSVRSASYGYAGSSSPSASARINWMRLNRFDVAWPTAL
jgi:hypothetical protein